LGSADKIFRHTSNKSIGRPQCDRKEFTDRLENFFFDASASGIITLTSEGEKICLDCGKNRINFRCTLHGVTNCRKNPVHGWRRLDQLRSRKKHQRRKVRFISVFSLMRWRSG
jgi:hypothetical protein